MGNVHEYRQGLFNGYDPYNHKPEQKTFGKWLVYEHGDMMYDDALFIPAEKILKEDTWLIHMMIYEWIDFNDFIPAYLQACKNTGKKRVLVRTYF